MNDKARVQSPDTIEEPLTEHEYDGIREYDNPLPGWWKGIFWLTFIFAVGYFLHYQVFGVGDSIATTYAMEKKALDELHAKEAVAAGNVTEETLAQVMADPDQLAQGKARFLATCAACHAPTAGGLIGPNLTDGYWLHGEGKLTDIFQTINHGVPQKGMPAWGLQLPPAEVLHVAAYVGSLRNTNVPGGKPPQGNPVAAATK